MTYPSGNYYEGEWKRNKKSGFGVMNWKTNKEKVFIFFKLSIVEIGMMIFRMELVLFYGWNQMELIKS